MKKNIDKKAIYNKIMEAVVPEIKKAINESISDNETDFNELYKELIDSIDGRTIDFVKADGERVTLDTVVDDTNLRVDVIYSDGTADTNVGTVDLLDTIADEDDFMTLIDLVDDYTEPTDNNEVAEEFIQDDTLVEAENTRENVTIYEIQSTAEEDEFYDLLPNYAVFNETVGTVNGGFVYTVDIDNDDVELFNKWMQYEPSIIDWRVIDDTEDGDEDLGEAVEFMTDDDEDNDLEDAEDDVIPVDTLNYGTVYARRAFEPDYNTDKSFWDISDEDGNHLCEIWNDTKDPDVLADLIEDEMDQHTDDLWDNRFDDETDDEFDEYEYEED